MAYCEEQAHKYLKKLCTHLLFAAMLVQAVTLSACTGLYQKQAASATPAENVQVYEGYYMGWDGNGPSFVPCDVEKSKKKEEGYWLVTNAQFDEMYEAEARELMQATIGTLPPGGEFGIYMKFEGIPAPPSDQGYGYQNQYRGQIMVTEAIQMNYFIVPWDEDLCKTK